MLSSKHHGCSHLRRDMRQPATSKLTNDGGASSEEQGRNHRKWQGDAEYNFTDDQPIRRIHAKSDDD
jgi:hypothetical protein